MLAYKIQMPGNYPEESMQHSSRHYSGVNFELRILRAPRVLNNF